MAALPVEAYDPRKMPVFFIHGAGGTPQDSRYYQPARSQEIPAVGYAYPTGLPIDLSAAWLNNFITQLHNQYGSRQLAVAAQAWAAWSRGASSP